MHRYWNSLVRPACEALGAKTIVEIGAAAGLHTELVLAFCEESGARLEIIDPVPVGKANELAPLLAKHATIHETTSHEALPGISGDVFLVDGDHNWFTVYHDLRLIEQRARECGGRMPLIFGHDVGWPYGRRDLYYAPERVPEEHRQPFARRGMVMGSSELALEGGFNYRHENALHEGGPKNGVLTAFEDFVKESEVDWRFTTMPIFHGLAILYHEPSLPEGSLEKLEALFELSPAARRMLEDVEEERMILVCELVETYRQLGGRPGKRTAKLVRILKRVLGTYPG